MKSAIAWLCVSIFCVGLVAPASARNQGLSFLKDPDQPINIEAKAARSGVIPGGIKTIFEDNVKVTDGDLTLTCERMELIFNDRNPRSGAREGSRKSSVGSPDISNIRSITATGNVKMVDKEIIATAGKALYDHLKRTITLTGGPPRFWQGPDMVIADMIVIYLDENRAELKSGADTKIKLIIPGKKEKEK
ncbi:MAG: hypothetical protein FJ118_14155 [Deltaproteobacteria bacterium]|nr:hypothetical protein [Deltaproteobacteria bacterium]